MEKDVKQAENQEEMNEILLDTQVNEKIENSPYLQMQEERKNLLYSPKQAKIIAVWGDNGITSLSFAIASALESIHNKQIVVISMDKLVPTNTMVHIFKQAPKEKSLAHLLNLSKINSTTVAQYLIADEKKNPNIATLAYCEGDNVLTEEKASYETYIQILKNLQTISDYIVVDCSKEVSNLMTLAALQLAEVQVVALTPDPKGLSFYKTNAGLLSAPQFNNAKRIFVANNESPYNDAGSFKDALKFPVVTSLPEDTGIRRACADGDMLNSCAYFSRKYKKNMQKLLKELL